MQKIGILTDTTSDLSLEVQDTENIKIIPLQVIFNDGRTFRDKYDISYRECMASLDEYDTKTSLPVIAEAVRAFDEFVEEGYTHVIVMTISHNLSGTYNMVKNVSEEYKDKLVIENIITRSVAYGIGHVAIESARMAAAEALVMASLVIAFTGSIVVIRQSPESGDGYQRRFPQTARHFW